MKVYDFQKKPKFLIIGASKSGTTSLNYYLNTHPQVYMCPTKETCFYSFVRSSVYFSGPGDEQLNKRVILDEKDYSLLFDEAQKFQTIGESSVWYIYNPESIHNINKYNSGCKLIAILRNPIERAFSSYMMLKRENREKEKDFIAALKKEDERIERGYEYIWHYKHAGFYYKQLKHIFDNYNRKLIKIYLYDDYLKNSDKIINDILEFIEVGIIPLEKKVRLNVSGSIRSKLIHNITNKENAIKSTVKAVLPKKYRALIKSQINTKNLVKEYISKHEFYYLADIYKEDICNLSRLINKNLDRWLKYEG